jgi:hypothetical protein
MPLYDREYLGIVLKPIDIYIYIIILAYFRKSSDDINILMVGPAATWI